MPTPFEAGKTAKELGIDTSRKFVVVKHGHSLFQPGTILTCVERERDDIMALFSDERGRFYSVCWHRLAYAFVHAHEELEPYQPRVGDRVALEGEIDMIDKSFVDPVWGVRLQGSNVLTELTPTELRNAKLLSRKTRTLTKAEAEALLTEKLGESVRIE